LWLGGSLGGGTGGGITHTRTHLGVGSDGASTAAAGASRLGPARSPPQQLPQQLPSAQADEICYRAKELPVANASLRPSFGWALVDDGSGEGATKLGFASTVRGSTLTLGPLPVFGRKRCGTTLVRLGYLLGHAQSHYHGAIELACRGCSCVRVSSPYQSRVHPFPIIQTDASLHHDVMLHELNVSVTISTSFWVAWQSGQPCLIHANHRQINYPQGGSRHVREVPCRVRIDSLALRPATMGDAVHLLAHPRDVEHRNLSLATAACAHDSWKSSCARSLSAKKSDVHEGSQLQLERRLCCLAFREEAACLPPKAKQQSERLNA